MARAEAAPAKAAKAATAAKPAGRSKMIIAIAGAAAAAAVLAGVGVWFASSHSGGAKTTAAAAKEAPKKLPAQYLSLAPAFVVNIEDDQTMRYLQVEVEVMTRDPAVAEAVKSNMPRIRNTLMLLFSQQHTQDVMSREGKEKLQSTAFDQVQAVLKEETGGSGIEALYFTNFVMQ